jgi:CheY-like chemotaxis protein
MPQDVEFASRFGMRAERLSSLGSFRVAEILLVASRYDALALEEGGQLAEAIAQECRELGLNQVEAPHFTLAETGKAALDLCAARRFDLVLSTARLPDLELGDFCRKVKQVQKDFVIGVLPNHAWELPALEGLREARTADWVFLWQGDVKPLLAMIRQVEDRRNAEHDILSGGVQAIIVVEDEPRFYSFFLPHLRSEITRQTSGLMAEGLNLTHRLQRMRAQPKILLAQSFEEAWELYQRYSANLLGVITDVSYPLAGKWNEEAGIALTGRIRQTGADLPIVLQSTEAVHRDKALAAKGAFIHKSSPTYLEEIRRALLDHFGFGDFVFRMPDGAEVARASDFRQVLSALEKVPDASVNFHAQHNHFSRWLKARTEFELAALVLPSKPSDFGSAAALRGYLLSAFRSYLRDIQRHVVADFRPERFDSFVALSKIGSGSLGGKGRGLAFMHKLLSQEQLSLPGLQAAIPQTVVLTTEVFDEFVSENHLAPTIQKAAELTDQAILDEFRKGRLTRARRHELARFLEAVNGPIAVRSSSLLEDSPYQPFAGVYATVMLPNTHPSLDVRLAQLMEAIKVVFSSTYLQSAREYVDSTPHRLDEEKMAVLLQPLVGTRRGIYFYPTVAGVACSHNFYPFRDMKSEDGVAQIVLGLGKAVVEGVESLRFCPAFPQVLPQFSTVKDVLKLAQRSYFALDMERNDVIPSLAYDNNLVRLESPQAIAEGGATLIASSYLRSSEVLSDGVRSDGTPLITFAPLLKSQSIPFAELLARLLRAAQRGMGAPVEIEFAIDLSPKTETGQTLHVLQVRPMMVERLGAEAKLSDKALQQAVVTSERALGHGRSLTLTDVVAVAPDLSRARTLEVAGAIEKLNHELKKAGRSYLLIGPGRWGSRDSWLGIPVTWSQISGARAIVETDFADLEVEPSQGSHFFHNLTSAGVAFFMVRSSGEGGRIDWKWLAGQPATREELGGAVRHLQLQAPLRVVVDGETGQGAIVPASSLG